MRRYQAFLLSLLAIDAVGLVLGSLIATPDPFTRLLYLGPMLVAAPVLSYWLVYRRGLERLGLVGPNTFE